jgi:hypothetical protein
MNGSMLLGVVAHDRGDRERRATLRDLVLGVREHGFDLELRGAEQAVDLVAHVVGEVEVAGEAVDGPDQRACRRR